MEIQMLYSQFNLNKTFYFHRQLEVEMPVVFPTLSAIFILAIDPRPTRWHRPWLANVGRAEAAGG